MISYHDQSAVIGALNHDRLVDWDTMLCPSGEERHAVPLAVDRDRVIVEVAVVHVLHLVLGDPVGQSVDRVEDAFDNDRVPGKHLTLLHLEQVVLNPHVDRVLPELHGDEAGRTEVDLDHGPVVIQPGPACRQAGQKSGQMSQLLCLPRICAFEIQPEVWCFHGVILPLAF